MDIYKINEAKRKLQGKSFLEQMKLIYQWVSVEHINYKEFLILIEETKNSN